jgi:hypothetical protein
LSSSSKSDEISQTIISSTLIHCELSLSNFISKISQTIEAVSKSIFELMFTIIQFFINSAISLGKTTPIFSDNSFTDKTEGIIIVSHFFNTKVCFISSTCFSSFFVFCNLFDLVKTTCCSSSK